MFNIYFNLLLSWHICAKLVRVTHTNYFIKSNWICFCDYLVLYLKTTSLNSLKTMKKKSPVTEYSDDQLSLRINWFNIKTSQKLLTRPCRRIQRTFHDSMQEIRRCQHATDSILETRFSWQNTLWLQGT